MVLLDTHTFVWLASDLKMLSPKARQTIDKADNLYLSSASVWEVGLLVKKGRLTLPLEASEFVERAVKQHGIMEIPIDGTIALASVGLPMIHNDPFDRVIVATARIYRMSIVSKDQVIPTYPRTKVLWE